MKVNPLLDKALSLLCHPISLAVLGLYGLNIFVFQRLSPNWFTGKLGDFVWIFLAPFALTALLAWLLPKRYTKHAFAIAVVCTVLTFCLIKVTPLISGIENLTGRPVSVVQDASDLSALTVVPVILWLWLRPRVNTRISYPAGVIATAFLALLTLADMAAPNLGITSVEFVDDIITACGGYYNSFQSMDGGQTWQPSEARCEEMVTSPKYDEVTQDPNDESTQYKFKSGLIERSTDGGKTWKVDYQWRIPSEAKRLYYIAKNRAWSAQMQTPVSAAIQPQTSDVYFAMGHEGILKRAAGNESKYSWITVGNYKKLNYKESELLFGLLFGEWMLAFMAGGAGVILLDRKLYPGKAKTVLSSLSMIGMVICALIFPPAPTLASPYISQFIPMGLSLLVVLMLSFTINAFINVGIKSKRLLIASIIGFVVVTIVSFVPYALWVHDMIPLYKGASLAAVAVAVLSVIAEGYVIRFFAFDANGNPKLD